MINYSAITLALVALGAPVVGQEIAIGRDRYAITLSRSDLQPATPAQARQARARIEAAAMVVCGASGTSLVELKRAIRRSACWRDSVADARRQIDDPLLAQAWPTPSTRGQP